VKLAVGYHLVRRFVGSLRPGPPPAADERWARGLLNEGERAIWNRMSDSDRRHGIGVARRVVDALGPDIEDRIVVAALLHDCGKVVSGLGTLSRVVATMVWMVLDDSRASRWLDASSSVRRRLAQYRRHPQLGAVLLAAADSDNLVISWAGEHHLEPAAWTVVPDIADVLKSCDDE
jgi:hypothetical protein